jgi:hypothetical protein
MTKRSGIPARLLDTVLVFLLKRWTPLHVHSAHDVFNLLDVCPFMVSQPQRANREKLTEHFGGQQILV